MITVRDLGWKYAPLTDGGKAVESLRHIDFDVPSGSFVGVIGPTGAGKSTLCMALAGIIPNLADGTMSGTVVVNGMNTARYSVSQLSQHVGYVQQDPESQLFCASVEDEIAFPLENRGIDPETMDRRIDDMLELVGMTGYRKRVPTSLSGGQMQISKVTLVAIAACLVIMVALMLFTGKSKVGTAMRAVSEDKGAAQLMGINVNTTISITFAIGSGLAAIAGVLLCSAYPTLMPTTGSLPGIKAFTAAVFGGIGSIPGAFIGGILLGIIEIFAKAYISTQLSDAIVFAVLIVVLLVKPDGLLGKHVSEKV